MKPLETPGVFEVFDEPPEEDHEFDLSKNEVYIKMKATPRSGDVGRAFLQIPTCVPASPDATTAYVVHEARFSYAGTKRRVLGVFRSRKDAEQKTAEALNIDNLVGEPTEGLVGDTGLGPVTPTV